MYEDDRNHIIELLQTTEKTNVQLAFTLAKGLGISPRQLAEPYQEIFEFFYKHNVLLPHYKQTPIEEQLQQLFRLKHINFHTPYSFGKSTKQRIRSKEYLRKSFLDKLATLTHLESIQIMGFSRLKAIPDSWQNLTKLRILDLRGNNIQYLPVLTSVKQLFLDNNDWADWNDSLAQFTQLRDLRLNHNRLSKIPDFLQNFGVLERLELEDNRIGEVPNWLRKLPKLRYLEV